MDISGGSTCVPGLSAHLSESVARAGNGESSKGSEEQNKIQPCTAPTQTPVRFKIRSAKERQDFFNKASSFKAETFDKGNRSMKVYREDTPKVHTISPPSPDTGKIDKRSRAPNPFSLTKKPEISIGSKTIQKNLDCNESLTTNLTERTALKQMYHSNRSRSLDWRGLKLEGGQENQMDVSSDTKDIGGRAMRRSESLMNSNELAHPLKRVSLHIQPLNGSGQRKQGSSGFTSSSVPGTSPVRTVALAQSFPLSIKANPRQDRTEERESPWYSGNSATTPDIAEHPLSSQVTATKVNEITRNQTVMGRNGHTSLEDNSQTSSGIFHRIITPAPFSSVQATDSNLDHSKPTRSSVDRNISVSSLKKMKTVSYNPEKCATFPKAPFKKEQMNFTTVPNTSVVLPNGKDTLDAMSTVSTEKPLSQDFISSVTNSDHDERRRTGNTIGLGTQSLGRTRHRHFTAPTSFSVYGLNDSNSIQKSTKSDTERQDEKTTSNSKLTKSMEKTEIPGKPSQSSQEFNPRNKPQSPKSMRADSEKLHPEHGIDLEFGSSGNPSKGLFQESPLASVRNTIHKFEALALQSQSSSGTPHPRRAFSVTEKPKAVASLNKTYSDRSLSKRWGGWNRESLKENLFSKSEVSDEAAATPGPVQTTTQDKEGIAVKAQIRGAKSQEHGVAQTLKQPDEFPSNQKNEKLTTMYTNVDEPDFSKGSDLKSYKKPKNIESSEDKVKNYLSSTVSPNSQKSSGSANMSHSDLKISNIGDNLSTKDKPFQKEITTMLQNSYSSTPVKTPSNLLSESGGITSIEALGDFSNPYNTMKDEKVAAKVIRWIMDKGPEDDDDEEEEDEGTEREYDSDSGESSVTITSNMSNRSFCMSLVELYSMGGLDLPVSDSSGSKDDDNWMSNRPVSMSSDVSALSSVTLLGMDELECLLNDVRGLEADASEQNYEDVHVVVLHKEAGSGLGFTVAGGVDQNKPVTVHKVLPTGLAAKEGSIHEGDQVLSINGTALHNSTHKDALQTMRKARGRGMTVVVIRRGDVTETCYSLKDSPQKAAEIPGSRVRITLNKSSSDLGFSLQGGVGSRLGDKPLTVQRLFQGGPVGKVFPGDELLEVEGQSLEGLRRLEVWYLIKRLPPGPVEVLLQRAHQ